MTQHNDPKSFANRGATPFAVENVPWEEWEHGARFGSHVRRLGKHGGGSHIGVLMEELPPGKQSSPAHYHLLEEEHVLVLEGQVTVRLGERTYEMAAGDYVCFPAGQAAAHTLINKSAAPCRFLVIGEHNPNDVVVYPDSGKVKVRATQEVYRKAAVDYWEGEDKSERAGD